MGEQIRHRKPRNPETDPNSKPTISSILAETPKKKKFTSATFRGLGCTASSQVSVPAVIRTSANWESSNHQLKKKRLIKTKKTTILPNPNPSTCDVWCAPLTTASVDCVVSTRPPPRPKVDGLQRIFRERSSSPLVEESETAIGGIARIHSDVSGSRHNRHVRHAFREGLAEIVILQSSLLRGGRSDGLDRYRDLRLDVDNMSYEELLELGDMIGYVSTGLGEDDINQCLRRTKLATLDDSSSCYASDMERQCSICQEDYIYERDDEMGKLNCGHLYHLHCIKQWLGQKNSCPICKTSAVSRIDA